MISIPLATGVRKCPDRVPGHIGTGNRAEHEREPGPGPAGADMDVIIDPEARRIDY